MKKVRIGIIGLGNMGSEHVKFVSHIEKAELAAVCDLVREKADKFAAQSGAKAFYDAETLFHSGAVDGVILAVPHYFHTPLAISAFEHGIHVLCEKPEAVTKSDAQKMNDAHAKHPELVFELMLQQRTSGAHRKIKQLIEAGEIGEIMRVNWIITNWFRSQSYYDSGSWRATWKGEGGGVLLNQCPHNLDLFQWFFGLPKEVYSLAEIGKYHEIEVEDAVNTICRFENGATGNFITSTGEFPGTNRLEITGTRGRLVYEDGKIQFRRTEVDVKKFCASTEQSFPSIPTWEIEIPYEKDTLPAHQIIVSNFVDVILDRSVKQIAYGEEGIRSVELGNAMLYSGLNHCTVTLPMDTAAYDAMLKKLIAESVGRRREIKSAAVNMGNSF